MVGTQQRQLGSPYQPLKYKPGFLETKTTSRAQRRERHSQAGFGRMRATVLSLAERKIQTGAAKGTARVRGTQRPWPLPGPRMVLPPGRRA